MFVQILGTASAPVIEVHDVENLKALHVLAPEPWTEQQVAEALRVDSWGGPVTEGNAWLNVTTLRRRAGAHSGPGWDDQFEAMLEYAARKGWCDESRALVRAHIEYH